MPLRDVVRAATARPAEVMGLAGEVGTLRPGAHADIALWRVERGPVALYDVDRMARTRRRVLRNTLTLVGGRALPARAARAAGAVGRAHPRPARWHREARTAPDPRAALDAARGLRGRAMTAGIADAAVDALLDEPLDPATKPLPPAGGPLTARTLGAHGWAVSATCASSAPWLTRGDLLLPALVLRTALAHNVAAMAAFCAGRGVALAPHGKTTMAPQIFRAQLAAGAWGITAATIAQVRAYRARAASSACSWPTSSCSPPALRWLAAELDADPAFEFLCLVDSEAAVERMTAALGTARRPVRVLVELGNVRTGARYGGGRRRAGRAAARSPALELAGLEGYEGTLGADRAARTVADVDAFLDAAARDRRRAGASGARRRRGDRGRQRVLRPRRRAARAAPAGTARAAGGLLRHPRPRHVRGALAAHRDAAPRARAVGGGPLGARAGVRRRRLRQARRAVRHPPPPAARARPSHGRARGPRGPRDGRAAQRPARVPAL